MTCRGAKRLGRTPRGDHFPNESKSCESVTPRRSGQKRKTAWRPKRKKKRLVVLLTIVLGVKGGWEGERKRKGKRDYGGRRVDDQNRVVKEEREKDLK